MRTLILASLAIAAALPLAAQNTVRWQVGGRTYKADVEAVDPTGQLLVRTGDEAPTLVIRPDTLPSLALKDAGLFSRGVNAMLGIGVGAFIGAYAGASSGDDKCEVWLYGCLAILSKGQKAGIGGVLGGLAGLVVGLALPVTRWQPWHAGALGGPVRPVVAVDTYGRPRLGVRVAF